MNWREELHNYLNNNGLLRIAYLNDNVLEPAVRNFVDEVRRFDALKKASLERKTEKTKSKDDITYFYLNVPHISLKSTPSTNPNFSCKIYVFHNQINFEVSFCYEAGKLLGGKVDLDIDRAIERSYGISGEELTILKAEYEKDVRLDDNFRPGTGTKYWEMKSKLETSGTFPYTEFFEVSKMADPDEVCRRLLSLYQENNKVYKMLSEQGWF
jgi:hypothetical protein